MRPPAAACLIVSLNDLQRDTIALAQDLIRRPSVSPDDAGCQQMIAARLESVGFACEHLRFGAVDNLWARHGTEAPLLVFVGHTDVVPVGDLSTWHVPPFDARVEDGWLHGRGAADMKGSVAAMVSALENFARINPNHAGSVALLLTSDEEDLAVDGTVRVLETLAQRKETIDFCLVGEPTCTDVLGDTIKNGRRGSLNGTLTIHGKQGHVAYPHLARNAIHLAMPALAELCAIEWDQGDDMFPPTSMQISNMHAGTGAGNVIPATLQSQFNFRFTPATQEQDLRARFAAVLQRHGLEYELDWRASSRPYYTAPCELLDVVCAAVQTHTTVTPVCATTGGTSDGRFVATYCPQVVEFGPLNATIHQVDERVSVADLHALVQIYSDITTRLLVR